MKFIYFLITFIVSFIQINAQNLTAKITLNGKNGVPLNGANIKLLHIADSTLIVAKQTNSAGLVVLPVEKNKQYLLSISSVGYQPLQKAITVNTTNLNLSFVLKTQINKSETVVVTGKKPMMRQEDDKTIVDAEVLANSSTNAYEVIEKTPGAIVDQDGNVYMASMQPATIQINGREVRMSAADLASLLKSLPANAVSKIEMTKNPSAKADAATTGGILNIVLRKGVKLGINGSVNMSHFQGVYGTTSTGFTANKNDDNGNIYINYNFTTRNSFEQLQTNRQFITDPTFIDQLSYTRYPGQSHFMSGGYEKDITKKLSVQYDTRLSLNNSFTQGENNTFIKNSNTNTTVGSNGNLTNNTNSSTYWNNSLSSKYKIDSLGSEWTTQVDYFITTGNTLQLFNNYFNQPYLNTLFGDGDIDSKRNGFIAQTDFKWKLPQKITFETGGKLSFINFTNNAAYFQRQGITPREVDTRRTNQFKYKEQIHALYAQMSKTMKGDFVVKAGVRYETTNQKGNQLIPDDTSFSINRSDFFPYLFVSKKLVKMLGFEMMGNIVVKRTINRPVYEQLNPFRRFVDQFLTESGNPSLRPQFTNNYEFNVSVDGYPILSVGYNETKDIFSRVDYQDDITKVVNRTFDNLGNNKEYYFRGIVAIPPGKKFFAIIGAQYNRSIYDGQYQGAALNFDRGTWSFFTYQNLKLSKTANISLNGFMRTKGVFNFYELQNFGQLSLSGTKTFLENKISVTLSMNDIFLTNQFNFLLRQGTVFATGNRLNDTRRVGLTLRYNFGIKPKEKQENILDQKIPE